MSTTTRIAVSDLVRQVGSLPSVAAQVVSLASDPDCEIDRLAKIIAADSAMSLRFLALANSAAVSYGQEIRDLRVALTRLGLARVRNVAMLAGIHDMAPGDDDGPLDRDALWRHNLATASCAQSLAWLRGNRRIEDAWLVGILNGLGLSSLRQRAGAQLGDALDLARREGIPLTEAEMRVFDFHHGELGGRVLRAWNLPPIFADAVEYAPESFFDDELDEETRGLIGLLRDAVVVARAVGFGDSGDGHEATPVAELAGQLGVPAETLDAVAARVDVDVRATSGLVGVDMPADQFAAALEATRSQVAVLGLEGLDDTLAREDLERELDSARAIQQRLLPETVPAIAGYDVAAHNRPSRHVSGDTYDFLTLRDGATAFSVADVSGKGMPAALLAGNLQASLRALARACDDPGDLLGAANGALFESTDPERFATVFLAAMNPDGTGFRYASAGHNPPLLLRADGEASWLKPAGTPLGMLPDMAYPVTEVALEPGDTLVVYTDGVTEAHDARDVEFEESGLEATVRAHSGRPADALAEAIIDAVRRHVAATPNSSGNAYVLGDDRGAAEDVGDDLTLIVLHRCG